MLTFEIKMSQLQANLLSRAADYLFTCSNNLTAEEEAELVLLADMLLDLKPQVLNSFVN